MRRAPRAYLLASFACVLGFGSDSHSNEQTMARSLLLGRLRSVAEHGSLFDPKATGRLLHIDLETTTRPGYNSPKDCGDGTQSSWDTTEGVPRNTWFKTLESGAGHLSIPAFTINPATQTGDPAVNYKVFHRVSCRDYPRLQDNTSAELTFDNIPAYACITVSHIRQAIPGSRFEVATDGVSMMVYQGQLNDASGTGLEFIFRAGVSCALAATIRQDQEYGLRYKRAVYNFKACRRPVEQSFCKEHGSFDWSDHDKLKAMVTLVYEKCGTPTTFYRKEPLAGQPPPKEDEHFPHQPCD